MGEAKGIEIREVEQLSAQSNGYPRDLLQRFNTTSHHHNHHQRNQESEEIELNLGLSLGGRFGVEPKESKILRSTSIAGLATLLREDDEAAPPPVVFPLNRTNSLPMENEKEFRKRKELQTLRRLEAKRKRSEKQKNTKLGRDRASLERNCDDKRVEEEGLNSILKVNNDGSGTTGLPDFVGTPVSPKQQQFMLASGFSPSVGQPFEMPNWTSSARGSILDSSSLSGKPNGFSAAVAQGFRQQPSSTQGSVASHGSSSSGFSEGLVNCNEDRSPVSIHSVPDQNEQNRIAAPQSIDTKTAVSAKIEVESPSKKGRVTDNGIGETGMKSMEDMPCVSTKGDGPNGRRIEGFLYKYKKGEEVRIVCVCHGSFLTPAEFVKHAGGGDVAHPLRHIVVAPSVSFPPS